MFDSQPKRRFRIARGLFRLWVVVSLLWISGATFAFWSGNGGIKANWVWTKQAMPIALADNATSNQGATTTYPPPPPGFVVVAPSSNTFSWDEAQMGVKAPAVISEQLPAYFIAAFIPPGIVLAVGASLVWATKGFLA